MNRVSILLAAAVCAAAADIPATLVSEQEAEPIRSAIQRKEAWTQDPVRRVRAEAEKCLKEGPWTVTADRSPLGPADPHDYYSEAPYWWPNPGDPGGPYIRREGQVNQARFLANRNALNAMSDAVFTLGAAAFLLEDPRYAQRASRLVNIWFVNPKTRMNPGLEHAQAIPGRNEGGGTSLIEGRALVRAIQGIEFLIRTDLWDAREQAAVRRWFVDYLGWLLHSPDGQEERRTGDSHATWWTAQVAAAATFVEEPAARDMAFAFYRTRVVRHQIRGDGSAPREEARARPLAYSASNLEAMATVCRIAQVHGVDLWEARGRGGSTIETVIDYLAPFLADPRKWSGDQTSDAHSDSLYALAFAGIGLKKPEYIALFRKLDRPDSPWHSLADLLAGRWEASAHQTRH